VLFIVEVKCLIIGVGEDVPVHNMREGFPDLRSFPRLHIVAYLRSRLIVNHLNQPQEIFSPGYIG
jgi:hypothetical protein